MSANRRSVGSGEPRGSRYRSPHRGGRAPERPSKLYNRLEAESQRTREARSSRALMRRVIRFICAPGRLRSCGVGSNNGGSAGSCIIIIIIPFWQFDRSFGKGHFPSPLEHAPKGCRCAGLVLIA